jgi:hypothetical protein
MNIPLYYENAIDDDQIEAIIAKELEEKRIEFENQVFEDDYPIEENSLSNNGSSSYQSAIERINKEEMENTITILNNRAEDFKQYAADVVNLNLSNISNVSIDHIVDLEEQAEQLESEIEELKLQEKQKIENEEYVMVEASEAPIITKSYWDVFKQKRK